VNEWIIAIARNLPPGRDPDDDSVPAILFFVQHEEMIFHRHFESLQHLFAGLDVAFQDLLARCREQDARLPSALRTSDPDMIPVLIDLLPPTIRIRCAPTPEATRALERSIQPSRPSPVATPSPVRPSVAVPIYRVAAEMYASPPWRLFHEGTLFIMNAPDLGLEQAALTFAVRENGLVMFLPFREHRTGQRYVNLCREIGNQPAWLAAPPYLTLGFATAPVSQEERERMNRLGWKASDPNVVPFLAACDGPSKPSRPATLAERDIVAAAAFSFLEMLDQDWHAGHFDNRGRCHTLNFKLFGDDRPPIAVELIWTENPTPSPAVRVSPQKPN
jgi:hypothetical protein